MIPFAGSSSDAADSKPAGAVSRCFGADGARVRRRAASADVSAVAAGPRKDGALFAEAVQAVASARSEAGAQSGYLVAAATSVVRIRSPPTAALLALFAMEPDAAVGD